MKHNKIIAFTLAGDPVNLGYADKMIKSFHHFHPDIEVKIYGEKEKLESGDGGFYYKATPLFGRLLLEKYDLAIKIDADSIITGSLEHIFEDETYDVGCVLNWNRVDQSKYPFPLTVWDIPIQDYMNCGFVAMRSMEFVEHWWKLASMPGLNRYRFAEQDLLNIVYHYGNYNVKCFDHSSIWHGLVSKGEWHNFKLIDNKLILPPTKQPDGNLYPSEIKEIKIIHWAGGNVPNKMNFNMGFSPEVGQFLKDLTGGK